MADQIEIVVAPTLGPDGYVFSSMKQADYLMAWFLASDYSQSNVHLGKISSFGWLVGQYNNDIARLVEQTQSTLQTYLGRYLNNVLVQCRDASNPDTPNQNILAIGAQFTLADGTVQELVRIMEISGSKFKLLADIATNNNS